MNKRAMFLTLITVTLVVAVIAFFMPNYESLPEVSRIMTVQTRINKANGLMESLHTTLLKRALTGSSYSAVKALVSYVNDSGKPLSDVQANFSEVVLFGTLNSQSLNETYGINNMVNNTFPEKLVMVQDLAAEEMMLYLNFTVNDVTIHQDNDTGFSQVAIDLNITINLDAGIAIWNTTSIITGVLELNRFYDPYYIINEDYSNEIGFANSTDWTVDLINNHILDINYTFETDAPSFLMRFENNSNASACCGMESFINPNEFGFVSDDPWTYVDYCYYSKRCIDSTVGNKSLWNITSVSSSQVADDFYGFKLEIYHITKYNLTDYMDKRVVSEP